MGKKIILGLAGVLIVMQFIPANLPAVETTNPDDLLQNNQVPDTIASMLQNACYDCHSNQTRYPWYSYVAPVKFLVASDTREGREHLNFSVWQTLSKADKLEALDDISEEVGEGEMPMKIYPIVHADARLTDADRQAIVNWAENFAEQVFDE